MIKLKVRYSVFEGNALPLAIHIVTNNNIIITVSCLFGIDTVFAFSFLVMQNSLLVTLHHDMEAFCAYSVNNMGSDASNYLWLYLQKKDYSIARSLVVPGNESTPHDPGCLTSDICLLPADHVVNNSCLPSFCNVGRIDGFRMNRQ